MFVNNKKSVFIVSGLFKGESSRIRKLKIVGILLAFTSGIAAVILISTQSQGSVKQNAVEAHYNPLLDPNCSSDNRYINQYI
uniref:Uncharacterized protein n=1 Tax=Acrobeloides nanus TaxID=290746 RepID=A0A914E0E2_9BILA